MTSSGVNSFVISSHEYCVDCDADFEVDVNAERISTQTVATYWECDQGHGHTGERT